MPPPCSGSRLGRDELGPGASSSQTRSRAHGRNGAGGLYVLPPVVLVALRVADHSQHRDRRGSAQEIGLQCSILTLWFAPFMEVLRGLGERGGF